MAEARSFWLEAPGRGALRGEAVCAPCEGEVMVRASVSAVSRGTEALVFSGRVPPSQYRAMRCPFQDGDFPAPVKYGYASVGIVEEGPRALVGRRVFCLHPHQDRYVVPEAAVRPVPERVPDARAALAANMETALNGVWDGAPLPGDQIAVVGAGVVGCLVASLVAKLPGTRVLLVDVNPARAAIAVALGCAFATPEDAAGEADIVFHTSGAPEGLATSLRLAGFEAKVVELSWYGDRAVPAPLGEDFHSRRLTLMSSQVGAVAASRRARWSRERRLDLALALLDDPAYDRMITGESDFADLPATMARLAASPAGALCHIVRYR
ncbi:MAG TPA: zinc-binding alcohol dehydrogenase [Stellaceae bacterium]|nr:zinc-binding alcohol dehydrogenase [Stellaceae bacterium]